MSEGGGVVCVCGVGWGGGVGEAGLGFRGQGCGGETGGTVERGQG